MEVITDKLKLIYLTRVSDVLAVSTLASLTASQFNKNFVDKEECLSLKYVFYNYRKCLLRSNVYTA